MRLAQPYMAGDEKAAAKKKLSVSFDDDASVCLKRCASLTDRNARLGDRRSSSTMSRMRRGIAAR